MVKRMIEISLEESYYSISAWRYLLTGGRGIQKNKVLINGSPKTGTTWMLMLANSIPGYRRVGNFNGDIERYKGLLPGDLAHGHDWYTTDLDHILTENNIKTILLMRDPRDQLISRVFHVRRDETHPWHERLKESTLDEAIMLCIEGRQKLPGTRTMIKLTQSWLQTETDSICVRYEEMLKDPECEFRRVLDYLEITLQDRLITSMIQRNQFERLSGGRKFWNKARKKGQEDPQSHFRKGIVGDWKNYLKEYHKVRFKEVSGEKLIELGYAQDFDW
jgi:hypothetical protein